MWEITSIKTEKTQIISDEVRANIIARGWVKRFKWVKIPERELKKVPIIPPEVKTNKKVKV